MTTQVKAINKKHQSLVNRAIKYDALYERLNYLRENADNADDEKLYRKYDRMATNAYDKFLDAMWQLPKREQKNIEKHIKPY